MVAKTTDRQMTAPAMQVPVVYFPRRNGEQPEPVPFVMTEDELIRFARIDETGVTNPADTIARYREMAILRGTRIGRFIRYTLPDVMKFLERLHGMTEAQIVPDRL